MPENRGWLRVRALVSTWFTALAIVCLVLAVVGGWAVYTVHAAPGTTVEQQEETHWQVTGEFQHSAEVTRENPAFEEGETLSNRSTYFIGASPSLDGRFLATYSGQAVDPASVTADATLVIQSVDGETVFWENRTSLAEPRTRTVDAGESTAVSFSVNASQVAQRRQAIEDALGSSQGEVETFVAVDVIVNGSVDGQPATLSFTHRLPIAIQGESYTVEPPTAGTETMRTTERTTVPREYGPFWSTGGPLLLFVGLVGLGALGAGQYRDEFALSPEDEELLAYLEERAEFEEWVVRMQLTQEIRDRPRAEAESLADLVDFAIDTNTAVVEDPKTGELVVVADEFLAVYEPPVGAGRSAFQSPTSGLGLAGNGDSSNDEDSADVDPSEQDDATVLDSDEKSTPKSDQSPGE